MEIVLAKDPFDYMRFYYVVKYDDKILTNSDALILININICDKLSSKTGMKWGIRTCVGGKCTIATQKVINRNKRKKWKGKSISFNEIKGLK